MSRLTQPRPLASVAWLFVLNGGWLTMRMFVGVPPAHTTGWSFTALVDLLLGLGLLARQQWALRWSGLWLVLSITLGVVALAILALLPFQVPFPLNSPRPSVFGISALCVRLAINIWQYRVLVRPEVAALFDVAADSTHRSETQIETESSHVWRRQIVGVSGHRDGFRSDALITRQVVERGCADPRAASPRAARKESDGESSPFLD